jgi:hypothetical protein
MSPRSGGPIAGGVWFLLGTNPNPFLVSRNELPGFDEAAASILSSRSKNLEKGIKGLLQRARKLPLPVPSAPGVPFHTTVSIAGVI